MMKTELEIRQAAAAEAMAAGLAGAKLAKYCDDAVEKAAGNPPAAPKVKPAETAAEKLSAAQAKTAAAKEAMQAAAAAGKYADIAGLAAAVMEAEAAEAEAQAAADAEAAKKAAEKAAQAAGAKAAAVKAPASVKPAQAAETAAGYVPAIDAGYVIGDDDTTAQLSAIIAAGCFAPLYITGHAGYGKTTAVLQAAARAGREIFRLGITAETCADDLIGSIALADNQTYYKEGIIPQAMKRGALVLLDEIDFGGAGLTCLQAVLEGGDVLIGSGEIVKPKAGFNIIATGNTTGNGDASGRYIHTAPMNAAMLDRFAQTLPFMPPAEKTETAILEYTAGKAGINKAAAKEICKQLLTLAAQMRKSFAAGAIDVDISTRRLKAIITAAAAYIAAGIDDAISCALRGAIGGADSDEIDAIVKTWQTLITGKAGESENNNE